MRTLELQEAMRRFDAKGQWLFTRAQFRILFPHESEHAQREALARHVKSGVLVRVAHQLYANPDAKSRGPYPLETIVRYLRPLNLNYVSLETALSERSVISQMTISYLTVMTTGAGRKYETPYGTIEFTHTSRPVAELKQQIHFDARRGIHMATLERAFSDLKRVGRNVEMVDLEEYEEQLAEEQAALASREP